MLMEYDKIKSVNFIFEGGDHAEPGIRERISITGKLKMSSKKKLFQQRD
jgi:hypothetical protein